MDRKPACLIIHGSTFFAPILVPLLFVFLAEDRYVRNLAVEALLFHIVLSICFAVSAFLMILLIGFVLLPIFALIYLWYPIKGFIRALNGEEFHYPLVGNWVR
jgi:uncharacterized protein